MGQFQEGVGVRVSLATQATPRAQTPQRTRLYYRPDIDGIRGAAAILVIGYHAHVPGFEGGFIGVDLFFVVSGFVIAGLLMGELSRNGRINWPAFYARRARRLIPAKATMLVGVLLLSHFAMPPTGGQQATAKSAAAAAGFMSNFYFWKIADTNYFGHPPGTGVLLHTWSLSVEEQFYLAMPLAVMLALVLARFSGVSVRRALLIACGALTLSSLALAIALASSHPDAAYYLPMTRAFEFGIGAGLSLVAARVSMSRLTAQCVGLAGSVVIIALLVRPLPVDGYPSYWALLPCSATVALVWSGCTAPTLVSKFLSLRPLVGLGLLSYGWYLWHWPLLVMGESVNLAPPPLAVRLMLVMIALGISWFSYRFIEGLFYSRKTGRHARRSAKPSSRVMVSSVTAMVMVAAAAGGALWLARGEAGSSRWLAVSAQLTDAPQLPGSCLEPGDVIPQQPRVCKLNDFQDDRPTVVLWGDSHAWMFIPAVRRASQGSDVNLVTFVMGGCPPFDPALPRRSQWEGVSSCERLNDSALRFVKRVHKGPSSVRVILGASWEDYRGVESLTLMGSRAGDPQHLANVANVSPFVSAGTPRLFEVLGALGIGTDVIAPTAEVPRNAPMCEAGKLPLPCDLSESTVSSREATTRDWLDLLIEFLPTGAHFIDVNKALCDDEFCYAERDGIVTYFDDNHLSASRARTLSSYFEASVQDAVQARTQ